MDSTNAAQLLVYLIAGLSSNAFNEPTFACGEKANICISVLLSIFDSIWLIGNRWPLIHIYRQGIFSRSEATSLFLLLIYGNMSSIKNPCGTCGYLGVHFCHMNTDKRWPVRAPHSKHKEVQVNCTNDGICSHYVSTHMINVKSSPSSLFYRD